MKELPWRRIGARLKSWTDVARKEWESLNPKVLPDQPYVGSRFSEVWKTVKSDPYGGLPIYGVTTKRFFVGFRNYIYSSSRRTLEFGYDLLPYFDKLVHPNGICLKGTWNITENNPFSGYFRKGTSSLIIARASAALTNTKNSAPRSLGFAGKIYPTTDPDHIEPLKTANFFTINDIGGNKNRYYLDAAMTNDIIKITPTIEAFLNAFVGLAAFVFFPLADRSNLQTALIRELYPISTLGEQPGAKIVTPIWLKIEGSKETPRIWADDFRDELAIANYPDGIKFDISVASKGRRLGLKNWQRIGYIEITDSVVSDSCDHCLHFAHPKNTRFFINPFRKMKVRPDEFS